MDDELFEKGLDIHKSVLGAEFAEKSIAAADDFNMPMQRLVTEYFWGRSGAANSYQRTSEACSISPC